MPNIIPIWPLPHSLLPALPKSNIGLPHTLQPPQPPNICVPSISGWGNTNQIYARWPDALLIVCQHHILISTLSTLFSSLLLTHHCKNITTPVLDLGESSDAVHFPPRFLYYFESSTHTSQPVFPMPPMLWPQQPANCPFGCVAYPFIPLTSMPAMPSNHPYACSAHCKRIYIFLFS